MSVLEDVDYPTFNGVFPNGSIITFNCTWNDSLEQFMEPLCNIGRPPGSLWFRVVVLIMYAIVCVVGLCGNTLVIYVVLRFSKMQTVTNLYIVNLAIADECFLVGIPFLMVTTALEYWAFGNIMCKIYFTTTSINQITSSMFLLIMSADRFVAVCHPISATKYRTPLIASIVALTAWSLSAIIMTPIFMYTSTMTTPDKKVSCNIYWPSGWGNGEHTFMVYSFLLGFLIPLALIAIFYILVIMRLRHVGPKRNPPIPVKDGTGAPTTLTTNQQNRARDRKKSHRKVTKLVLTVIAVYFVCWAPYWISQLILLSTDRDSNHSEFIILIYLMTNCLSYSNSAMNPILYAFLSENFKKSFLKACSCANQKDINAALHIENSVFPRRKGENPSDKQAIQQKKGNKSGGTGPSTGNRNITNPNHFLNKPPKIIASNDPMDEDGFLESDDEGAAILGRSTDFTDTALTTRSGISEVSKMTQETSIQDGVHITAL